MLPELVDGILKSDKTLNQLFADGDYDNNDVFRCLTDKGILHCIKVRKNARVGWKKENIFRNLSVIFQKNNLQD